jgi:uncharacterized repeat protein (TIGR01451 family)
VLTDPASIGLNKTSVACSATPGQCVTPPTITQLEAGFALPALASGATYQVVVAATVTAASGTVSNTATIAPPIGVTDPTPGNNSSTDTDPVTPAPISADLGIVKTNNAAALTAGGSTVYTLVVTNYGPAEVTNAVVTDLAPAGLTFGAWTCAVTNPGAGGSVTTACSAANGVGNLSVAVTMKVGAVITFTVPATVAASATGSITNVATVNPPAGVIDPTPANSSATDVDPVLGDGRVPQSIPTLSAWGLIVLSLLLAMVTMGALRPAVRRK